MMMKRTKHLYLHIGTHKTGSTSIQKFLKSKMQALRDKGVTWVPTAHAGQYLKGQTTLSDLLDGHDGDIVISNENFSSINRLKKINDVIDYAEKQGFTVLVIAYLRPAIEYFPSLWAQYVKIGSQQWGVGSLDEFIEGYQYDKILLKLNELKDRGVLKLLPYSKDVVPSFIEVIGLDYGAIKVLDENDTATQSFLKPSDEGDEGQIANLTPPRQYIDTACYLNRIQIDTKPVHRDYHKLFLNLILRQQSYPQDMPKVIDTVTKGQFERILARFASYETSLWDGEFDSVAYYEERYKAAAPDEYSEVLLPAQDLNYAYTIFQIEYAENLKNAPSPLSALNAKELKQRFMLISKRGIRQFKTIMKL